MISEHDLARSYSSFWKDTTPFAELYVREINASLCESFARHLDSHVSAERRALVNEVGFGVFVAVASSPHTLNDDQWRHRVPVVEIERRATLKLSLLEGPPKRPRTLDIYELEESRRIAERLQRYFAAFSESALTTEPGFRGCGMIDSCTGDILVRGILYEIKAGNRAFRSEDLRQLLIYCALNLESREHEITEVGLVNPRLGTYLVADLEELCGRVAGTGADNVLSRIVAFLSSDGVSG